MTRRYGLRDEQWERIKELLPGREGTVGVTAPDNRLFVEAVSAVGFPGETCQNALGIIAWFIPGLAVGQKREYGTRSLRC